jgi:hypothetical protein
MLPLAPVSKGRAGLLMVRELLALNGYATTRAKGIAQSLTVKKLVVKVKLSLEWEDATFAFEQIEDDPYDLLAMLGLRPREGFLSMCPKAIALRNAAGQHKQPSRWVVFSPSAPPRWLAPHGGNVSQLAATLSAAFGTP